MKPGKGLAVRMIRSPRHSVKHQLRFGYHEGPSDERVRLRPWALPELREKLSERAFAVWCLLLGLRDRHTGVAHPTVTRLAAEIGATARTTQRAVRELRDAGLVEGLGKSYVPKAHRVVYCWRVWGQIPDKPRPILVPVLTKRWAETANRPSPWGGRRAGSGRPTGSGVCDLDKSSGGPIEESLGSRRIPYGDTPRYARTKACAPARARDFGKRADGSFGFGGGADPDAGVLFLSLVRRGVVPAPPIYGRALRQVMVPLPPQLSDELSEDDALELVARAYRSAVELFTGKKSHAFRRGNLRNSKHADRLIEFVETMRGLAPEKRISPPHWFLWQMKRWGFTHRGKQGHAAPVNYVLAAETLRKPSNRGWMRTEMGVTSVRRGVTVVSKEMVDLKRRFGGLRFQILQLGTGASDDAVRAVVEQFFPDDTYQLLMQAAAIAQDRLQERVDHRVAAGDLKFWGRNV